MITKIDFPSTVPTGLTDWSKMLNIEKFLSLLIGERASFDFSGNTVKQGVQIMIGGSVYQATSDESITGTPSDFVKIIPSGSTASASYVANLTGVTWNSIHNFYQDVSGNAYLFSESKQVALGIITDPKTILGLFALQAKVKELQTNLINELTAAAGVTIDGVLLKDGIVNAILKGNVQTDLINELTAGAGVNVDGVLLKDGIVNATNATLTGLLTTVHATLFGLLTGVDATFSGSLTYSGPLEATASVQGSWDLTTSYMIVPKGFYVVQYGSTGDAVQVEQQTSGGGWDIISKSGVAASGQDYITIGDPIISDGVNTRIKVTTGSKTVYWRKY